jgi:Nitroreductase family
VAAETTNARLSRTELEAIVAAAAAAPSVLNTQPWQFVAHGDVIDVYADPTRSLQVSDPDGRALTISCGAALLNLRLAIAALGREPVVQLLPKSAVPTWLARVRAAGRREPTAEERALHAAIPRRGTSRLPFASERLGFDEATRLEDAAATEGCRFRLLGAWEESDVAAAVRDADRAQRADPDVRAEVEQWIHRPAGAPDGISDAALGPRPTDPQALVRDFALGMPVVGRETAEFETAPSLGVLYSAGDAPADWLRAGQALERVLLVAIDRGLQYSLLTQALEVASLRWLLRAPNMGPMVPQALLRLGYGPPPPKTGRRPVADVLQAS